MLPDFPVINNHLNYKFHEILELESQKDPLHKGIEVVKLYEGDKIEVITEENESFISDIKEIKAIIIDENRIFFEPINIDCLCKIIKIRLYKGKYLIQTRQCIGWSHAPNDIVTINYNLSNYSFNFRLGKINVIL